MDLLIDTHTFIRVANGNKKLSLFARNLIEDSANKIYVSIASLWEIAIKVSLEKLQKQDYGNLIYKI